MMDFTNLTSANNMYDVLVYANGASNNFLVAGFVIAFFIILTLALKKYSFEKGFLVSSWSSFTLSLLLWMAKLLPIYFPISFLIVAGITAFIVWKE